MKRRANPARVGLFVVGALVLVFAVVFVVAGGRLFASKERAVMHFSGSIYGLQVGAPVVLRGVRLGSVTAIGLTYDHDEDSFSIPVVAELDRTVIRDVRGGPADSGEVSVQALVGRGLRAQLTLQSLLTGQLYIDLDFRPDRPALRMGSLRGAVEIPTVATPIQELKNQFDGLDLRKLLEDVSAIATSARRITSGPELERTLQEVQQIAVNVNRLTAQLQQRLPPLADSARSAMSSTQRAMDNVGGAAARVDSAAGHLGSLLAPDAPLVTGVQRSADSLAASADALRRATSDDSRLMLRLDQALQDVSQAARALRLLSDTLEREPESLLRGRRSVPAGASAAPPAVNEKGR